MKKQIIFLTAMMLVLVYSINADIWTVSNNPHSPGQYTDLQAAIDNASPEDTILVSGSQTPYGAISVYKKLTIIGPGWVPLSEFGFVATIDNGINFDTVANPNSSPSGSKIMGLVINSIGLNDPGINNIIIERNKIGNIFFNYDEISDCSIIQNLINGNILISYNSNLLISNNIISGQYSTFHHSNEPTVMISNNLFFRSPSSYDYISHATFSNNIFLKCPGPAIQYSFFYNNITYAIGYTCDDLPFGTNIGSGNLNNTDPEFINGNTSNYDPDGNYRLGPTSPGKNAGTDGTDIGIYGGPYPFVDGGIPPIPQILLMHVSNPVPLNSDIDIHIKARKQD